MSPKNGSTNINATVISVGMAATPSISRSRAQWVSSPRLPYQITRYWPNVRYPQKAVNAKHSFPRSWKCLSCDEVVAVEISPPRHHENREARERRDPAAHEHPPAVHRALEMRDRATSTDPTTARSSRTRTQSRGTPRAFPAANASSGSRDARPGIRGACSRECRAPSPRPLQERCPTSSRTVV